MGANTLRALASHLAYLGAWCALATDATLPWPAPEPLLLKFVAHHLWDPVRRESEPAHGMPAEVDAGLRGQRLLRSEGPHAPAAVAPVNDAPSLVPTQTLRQISEDASIASARKVATLSISDPNGCSNKRWLAGSDAKPRQ